MSDENSGLGCLFILLMMGACGYWVYLWVDSQGYIQHSVETSISAKQEWLVGEMKDCLSFPLTPKNASVSHQQDGYVGDSLTCDDGPFHRITVKLYGQLEQPGRKVVTWHCTRESEGFTCRQTGAD
jgi:hypothetical protein